MNKIRSVSGREIEISPHYLEASTKDPAGADKYCKVCGRQGLRVLEVTIRTHVVAEYWKLLDGGFRFSSTPECSIFYYNNHNNIYFLKDEVKTRFGLKEAEDPKPLCYCIGVLEEDIRREIIEKGCCDSLKDIVNFTKAGTGRWCLTTNPSGKCCREYLGDVVDKYLRMKGLGPAEKELESIKGELEKSETPVMQLVLKVDGMTCESCSAAVASALEKAGGLEVRVSFEEGFAEVGVRSGSQPADLVSAIEEIGYGAKILKEERVK